MTVGELKRFLKRQPDSAEVVVPGRDHSYRKVSAQEDYAARCGFKLHEWHEGEPNEGAARVDVVVMV